MQGRNQSDKQLVDSFMSQSKKYFKEDVYIFEWTMNVVCDTFKLLNGFEFTVYQIEILNIVPLQVISNGFRTTHKSGTDQDSFIPHNSNRQNAHDQNIKVKNQLFEFDKSQTQKITQDQIKNKFNFKQNISQGPVSQSEFQSDYKSISFSSRNNVVVQSPSSPQKQVAKPFQKQTSLSVMDHYQSELIQIKKQNIQDLIDNTKLNDEFLNSQNNTEMSLIKNGVIQQRNDLLMEMTEDELNKLRKSYDDIDFVAAQGIEKNLPNQDFPIRMELVNNQQLCDEDNQLNKTQPNKDSPQSSDSPKKNTKGAPESLSSRQGTSDGSSKFSYQTSKSQVDQQQGGTSPKKGQQVKRSQSLNRQQSQFSNKSDKDDDQKRKAKQRMSIIQENLNDSEIDLNLTSQGLLEHKINETQQNLLAKHNLHDNFKTEATSFSIIHNTNTSPIIADSTQYRYEQNDTINIYKQISTQQNESEVEDQRPLQTKQSEQQQYDDEYQEQYVFNKNRSLASNFFNEQQILTRNSTFDKDSNPILANLQMLRESTKYSKHKVVSQQQELSDGPTIDDLDKNAESLKNESTEKEEVKFKPLDGDQRVVSVASSQNSQVSTMIQRIYYSASSKKMPFFMSLFFQVIGFQLIFFGSICAIVCMDQKI